MLSDKLTRRSNKRLQTSDLAPRHLKFGLLLLTVCTSTISIYVRLSQKLKVIPERLEL